MDQKAKNRSLRSRISQFVRDWTAGLGFYEIRSILRGDPPVTKPNPRFRAHVLSMWAHIRPRYYKAASLRFTHTFRLGFFTVFFFIVEAITGFILMIYYVPTPEGAYGSIIRLMTRVPFGELLRDIHRLAAEGMVVFCVLHLLRTFLTGSYKKERSITWVTGVALLLLTLGLSFSGYLLPWDQLAYWAITIGTSMVEAVPLIGMDLNILLRGAETISADGLLRFYQLHVIVLPMAAFLLLSVHYYRVARIHNISLPASIEEGNLSPEITAAAEIRVNYIPDIIFHEMFMVSVGLLILVVSTLFYYDAPLESHANPLVTPLETEAPWFFLWVQGLLKLGDKLWMGVVVPVAVVLFLFLVPYLDINPRRMLRKRPLGITLSIAILAGLGILTYMGTAGYGISIPPAVKISHVLAPEEDIGPLHRVPYEELQVGVYETGITDSGNLPETLADVFQSYEGLLREARQTERLPDGRGLLIVEEWQQDLKKVTMRIIWTDVESDTSTTYERVIYLHRERSPQAIFSLADLMDTAAIFRSGETAVGLPTGSFPLDETAPERNNP